MVESAGATLSAPPQDGADASPKAGTCTIPADLLPDAKPGDMFKVQGVADGQVTLEHQGGGDEADDWGSGLNKAAARPPEEEMA